MRHLETADTAAIMALNAEPSTARWLPSHVYADLAEAREVIGYLISCYREPGHPQRGPYVLAVEDKGSGKLLGHVGFSPIDSEVEVSYAIAESERGRGLGVEALDQACSWAWLAFKVPYVIAITSFENSASIRLLEKTKFQFQRGESMRFQGTEQQVVRYVRHLAPHGVA